MSGTLSTDKELLEECVILDLPNLICVASRPSSISPFGSLEPLQISIHDGVDKFLVVSAVTGYYIRDRTLAGPQRRTAEMIHSITCAEKDFRGGGISGSNRDRAKTRDRSEHAVIEAEKIQYGIGKAGSLGCDIVVGVAGRHDCGAYLGWSSGRGSESRTSKSCVQGSGVDVDEGNDNNEMASGSAGVGDELAKGGR
ncbi:hypothetical protein BGY98DRAFT_1181707 [Russula aff. rugulosa BPL654]|nr:hypothetical protein BGY98DRAFT_1181707 [Russula aff. rugulosa BPL654]